MRCRLSTSPDSGTVLRGARLNQIQILQSESIVNIVGFADASEKAYGNLIYFHVQNGSPVSINLIWAKSKLSPSEVVSLPRLELCAVLLMAQSIINILKACCSCISINRIFAFLDSTVVLCGYIHHPIVGIRLSECQRSNRSCHLNISTTSLARKIQPIVYQRA